MARRKNYGPAHVAAVINPRAFRNDQRDYKFYVVRPNGLIESGFEYKEDAQEFRRENRDFLGKVTILSRARCPLDPKINASWTNSATVRNPSSSYLDYDAPRHVAAVLGNPRRRNAPADDRALVSSMARWHKAEHRKPNPASPARFTFRKCAGGYCTMDAATGKPFGGVWPTRNDAAQYTAMCNLSVAMQTRHNPVQRLANHHLAVGTRVRLTSGRRAGLIAKQLPSDWYVVLIDGAGYETLRGRDLRRA